MITRQHNETEYLIIGDKVGDILAFDLPSLSKKKEKEILLALKGLMQ